MEWLKETETLRKEQGSQTLSRPSITPEEANECLNAVRTYFDEVLFPESEYKAGELLIRDYFLIEHIVVSFSHASVDSLHLWKP